MKGETVSPVQLQSAVLGVLVVKAFFTYPRAVALTVSTAAPWAVVLAAGVAALLLWPVMAALARRPGENLMDLAIAGGGRPLAIGVSLLLAAFFVLEVGITLRQVAEMAVTGFFPFTPQTAAMSALLAAAVAGAAALPPGLVWVAALSLWPLLTMIGLILVGSIGWGQVRYLLPLTGPGPGTVGREILPLSAHFGEAIYLAIWSRYLSTPAGLVRAGWWSVMAAGLILAATALLYLMVFPLPGGLRFPFPLLHMARLIQGGRFMERLDALWIFPWAFGSAGVAAWALQAAALLLRDAFGLPGHGRAVLPLAVAALAVALMPANQAAAMAMDVGLTNRWGFLPTLVLPWMLVWLARRREAQMRG